MTGGKDTDGLVAGAINRAWKSRTLQESQRAILDSSCLSDEPKS